MKFAADRPGFRGTVITGSLLLGGFLGWGVLRAGIVGVIGLIALLLVLGSGERRWERLGACLLGLGLAGTVAFARVMIGSRPCGTGSDACYAVETIPALIISAGIAVVGLALLVVEASSAIRGRTPPSA